MNFVRNSKTVSLLELYFPMFEDDFIAADNHYSLHNNPYKCNSWLYNGTVFHVSFKRKIGNLYQKEYNISYTEHFIMMRIK